MYLVKPKLEHEQALQTFLDKCEKQGDTVTDVFGSEALANIYTYSGFKSWVGSVKKNELARSPTQEIEPGHTFLMMENISGSDGVDESVFPQAKNGQYLVGVVTLRTILEDWSSAVVQGAALDGSMAIMTLTVVPEYRNTASYMLAIQDALAHIVCAGLPYKYVRCVVAMDKNTGDYLSALEKCNFTTLYAMTSEDKKFRISQVDLRAAHQLRSRIQEHKEEG